MFKAISFTMAATLVGQVLNFLTDILIANYFGTRWKADAYMLALLFPMIIYDLCIAGIGATFIPLYVSRKKAGDAQDFFRSVINLTGVITLFIGATLFFLVPYLINLVATGFSEEAKGLTVVLTRLLLFLVVTMPISAVLSNLLNAHGQFAIPALGKASNFACIILSMIFLVKIMDIYALVLGFFMGSLLFLTVQIYLFWRAGIKYLPAIQIKHPSLKELGTLLLPLLLATFVNYANIFVERSVAASFAEGSIAALNYAFKVINIPVNLLVLAAMTVIFPTLSMLAAEGDIERLTDLILKGLKFISFIMVPIITGMVIFRIPLVKLLFERGEFTQESTEVTVSVLLFYAAGILGLSVVTLLTRVFYSLKKIKRLSKISVSMILINIALIIVLSKTLGFVGIPLTFSITYTIHMVVMTLLLEKGEDMYLTMPFLKSFIKHALASGIMAGACLPFLMALDYPLFSFTAGRMLFLLLAAVIGTISYIVASFLLRVEEVGFVFEKAKTLKFRFLKGQEGKDVP